MIRIQMLKKKKNEGRFNKEPHFSKVQYYIIALERDIIPCCLHNKDDSVTNNFGLSLLEQSFIRTVFIPNKPGL